MALYRDFVTFSPGSVSDGDQRLTDDWLSLTMSTQKIIHDWSDLLQGIVNLVANTGNVNENERLKMILWNFIRSWIIMGKCMS